MEKYIEYRGITIRRMTKYGAAWFGFVLNHAPYELPSIEDCRELIDIALA